MKYLIGKSCRLTISLNGKNLFYTANKVLEVTATHITFIDKFNKQFCYRLQDLVEIQDVRDEIEIPEVEDGG